MRTEIEEAVVTGAAAFAGWVQETEKDLIACTCAKKITFAPK